MTRPAAGRSHRRGVAPSLGGAVGRRPGGVLSGRVDIADHADEVMARPPWWRYLTWPAIAVVVGTGAMLASGVPAWRAVVIAVACGVALWAVVVSLTVAHPEWPYDIPVDGPRTPTTWQVAGLVGAMESDVSFQHYLRPRLWALAQQLLQRRGIDPRSDRAVAMIGPREYALLVGTDTDPRRSMAAVPVLCQVIARLAVQPAPGNEPAIRNPALAGLAGAPGRSVLRRHSTPNPHPHPNPNPNPTEGSHR